MICGLLSWDENRKARHDALGESKIHAFQDYLCCEQFGILARILKQDCYISRYK